MPWCPICKNEYKDGYTHCNDCNADLVPTFEDLPKAIMFGSQSDMEQMKQVLVENQMEGVFVIYSEKDDCYELVVSKKHFDGAKELLSDYMAKQAEAELGACFDEQDVEITLGGDEVFDAADMEELVAKKVRKQMLEETYVDKKAKSADYKSSGYTLLGVGGIGLIIILLNIVGVIKIPIHPSSIIMMYIVMGALFLIFVISGVLALRSSKRLLTLDEADRKEMDKVNAFLADYTAETIDREIAFEETAETEMKYYQRIAYLNRLLSEHFPDVSKAIINKLCEDHYDRTFGDE